MSEYAKLGTACQTSCRVMLDASIYLPLNQPTYSLYETRFLQKPAQYTIIQQQPDSDVEQPKTVTTSGCCGSKS